MNPRLRSILLLLLVLALIAATFVLARITAPVPRTITVPVRALPASATQTTTIAFLGQMEQYDVGHGVDNPLTYLGQLQADHFGGFVLDDHYQGVEDDVQNGGVGRMGSSEATAISQVSSLVTQARAAGLTQTFLRLNASVYCPSCVAVTGSASEWDMFNATEAQNFVAAWTNQASFASQTGMTGIWFDGEPYGELGWDQTQDPSLIAATTPVAQVRAEYFSLGQQAVRAVTAVNPALRIILDPVINNNPGGANAETYTYCPDFVAGMIDVLQSMPGSPGLIIAPENSFAATSTSSPTYSRIYSNVMGVTAVTTTNGIAQYYGIREGIQYWTQQTGIDLWDWHLANDKVMLPTQPISYKSQTDAAMWGTPTDMPSTGSNSTWLPTFQANLQAIRNVEVQNGSPYSWVYDNHDGWMLSSYSCQFPAGTVFSSTQPCPGVVSAQTLPTP